jgi:pentatricopeptide repeat protein
LKDIDLAAEVFEKVADSDAAMLRTIVERAASTATSTSADVKFSKQGSQVSQDIKACGKNGDLEGAIRLFSEQAEMAATGVMYNSIMDACVECGKLDMAMDYFSQARVKGLADIVSYNTAMKGCVSHGKVDAANRLFAELSEKGLAPTLASYHILVNFQVTAGDRVSAWNLFEAMQSAGIRPTPTTCSILLKGKALSVSDMDKVLEIIDTMPLDEVLFHSLAEACVRTGKLHVLAQYRAKLASQDKSPALTAPTYGSMIKAYGQAHDVEHVWSLWEDMTGHGIKPTAITLGCMVEALVANWCTADAWKLVQDIRGDQSTRDLVNTVVYSSILKGFAYAKETHQVMALYKEMKAEGIEANTITFNTILNAFAQGGAMDRVPALLEDMKASTPPVEPDIVTYSTIVKGYCNSGSLDRALAIVRDMQSDGKLIPDEVMYNSILDGCAKEHRPNEALNILAQMKEVGVSPSNFTLSILVKLMGRCRRLNQAFSIIEDARRDYGLKWNIQVYTCLIQACFNNRQASKAVALHDQMIEEGVVPDEMAYSALVKGCLQASLIDKAIHLARCAHGLAHPKVRGIPPGINARTLDELSNALDPTSSEAKALLAELASCQVMSSKGGAKGKGKGKGSCKGGDATQARRQS